MNCVFWVFKDNMWEKVGKWMGGFFFSGSHTAKIDEKGRFVLPQEMRFGLVEDGKCEFSIGLGLGGCLTIYKKSAIEKIVQKFQKHQHTAKFQKFFTLFFSTLFQTECDKVGRASIPARLKKAVGIEKEIVVAGVMDKIEIWPKAVFDASLENADFAKMTDEAFALLQEEETSPKQAVESVMNPAYVPN